jgi:hypothetical protein
MSNFAQFAGQLVQDGIGVNSPMNALEESGKALTGVTINGLMPKISRVFIEETKIFNDPFGGVVQKVDDPYGVGIETAGFMSGAANKLRDGTCMPTGTVALASQVNYINWSYNVEVKVYDREVNKGVMGAEEAGKYIAEKLKTPLKTVAQNHYRSWLQLLSDVVDGERTVASTSKSDGTGAVVSYAPDTIVGYAGMVEDSGLVIPAPVAGSLTTIAAADALAFVQKLEGVAADMKFETDDYNLLGIQTFITGRPLVFAETKTLNAIDHAWATAAANKAIPTKTGREYLARFADVVEIDAFPAIPTQLTYATQRLGAVLIDRDALREVIKYADVESMRCPNERATGYNYQGESIMAIWAGAPSYAMLVDPSGS